MYIKKKSHCNYLIKSSRTSPLLLNFICFVVCDKHASVVWRIMACAVLQIVEPTSDSTCHKIAKNWYFRVYIACTASHYLFSPTQRNHIERRWRCDRERLWIRVTDAWIIAACKWLWRLICNNLLCCKLKVKVNQRKKKQFFGKRFGKLPGRSDFSSFLKLFNWKIVQRRETFF